MKVTHFLCIALVVLGLGACGKKNEVPALQNEAKLLAKFYAQRLAAFDARLDVIMKRGATIPGNLPGIDNVTKRVQEARDKILALRGIVGPDARGGDKSAVEKMADQAAKDNKVADLRRLVYDTQKTLVEGVTVINDNLTTVEGWIAQYDRQALAMPAQQKGDQPETPATGQPPGATEPAPAPAQPNPAPAQPNPAPAQPAQPKP